MEIFKPENVKYTNGTPRTCLGFVNGIVDFVNNVDKETSIDALDKGIPNIH